MYKQTSKGLRVGYLPDLMRKPAAPAIPGEGAPPPSEPPGIEALRARAKELGIKYVGSMSEDTLREKIAEAEGKQQ
jgi:hypothetical protein